MPQQNFSSKLGTSTSPVIARVIKNVANGQAALGTPQQAIAQKFQGKTVKLGK